MLEIIVHNTNITRGLPAAGLGEDRRQQAARQARGPGRPHSTCWMCVCHPRPLASVGWGRCWGHLPAADPCGGVPGPCNPGQGGDGGVDLLQTLFSPNSSYWFLMAELRIPSSQTWPQMGVRECAVGAIREVFLEEARRGGQ